MALQLPEPDFYTLAEVAKRWSISEDMLLRLGVEKKIIIGAGVVPPINLVNIGTMCFDEEPLASFLPHDWAVYVDGNMQPIINDEPIPKRMYMQILNASELLYTIEYTKAIKDKPAIIRIDPRRTNDDLVIPASEVHRLEHQHETAEKAATDDVLGTKERETMQAVIAAMTQIIAGTAPMKYKHGDHPNVDAIARALEGMIPDRKKRGVSETISKALKAGLILT